MANVRTPREAWLDEALRAISAGGPDAVRVEVLAATLGVTKGGFYWHFKNRQALLDETLDAWEKEVVDDVIARVESQPTDPRGKLQHLFQLAAKAGVLPAELAVRDWARRDEKVAERLRGIDNRRMDFLRSLFGHFCPDPADVEARSLIVMALFVGNDFIAAEHPRMSRGQVLQTALDRLLSTPTGA
ncbi:hypothetical protein BH10ACT11_BH10ACT11_20520 [soil metagenome]